MIAPISRTMFTALVARAGGVDAAAAVLTAVRGEDVNKSTVSRMTSGVINITPEAIMALEDALQFYPMTDYMAARRTADLHQTPCQLMDRLTSMIKETGEALAAGSAAVGGGDKAAAILEANEAVSVMQSFINDLEAAT